jgi:hypothetical protein
MSKRLLPHLGHRMTHRKVLRRESRSFLPACRHPLSPASTSARTSEGCGTALALQVYPLLASPCPRSTEEALADGAFVMYGSALFRPFRRVRGWGHSPPFQDELGFTAPHQQGARTQAQPVPFHGRLPSLHGSDPVWEDAALDVVAEFDRSDRRAPRNGRSLRPWRGPGTPGGLPWSQGISAWT